MSTMATDSQTEKSWGAADRRSLTKSATTLSLRRTHSFEVSDSRKFNLTRSRVWHSILSFLRIALMKMGGKASSSKSETRKRS